MKTQGQVTPSAALRPKTVRCIDRPVTKFSGAGQLRHVFADGGYAGDKLRLELAGHGRWTIEVIKRSDRAQGFEVSGALTARSERRRGAR